MRVMGRVMREGDGRGNCEGDGRGDCEDNRWVVYFG